MQEEKGFELKKTKKLLLVMNPCAGTKKANKYLTDILVLFGKHGYENTVYLTEASGDAKAYVKQHTSCLKTF